MPRYIAAWFATFMTLGMIGATLGDNGNFNGSEMKDFPIWKNALLIGAPALVAFLIVRRWRKPKTPESEQTADAA